MYTEEELQTIRDGNIVEYLANLITGIVIVREQAMRLAKVLEDNTGGEYENAKDVLNQAIYESYSVENNYGETLKYYIAASAAEEASLLVFDK